ncbi:MAG: DUF354 domain-containing protein [Promethearchaeota archaeon]
MKIWIDFNEPKCVVMLKGFVDRELNRGEHDFLFTARDFDSTLSLLDDWGISYHAVGRHGVSLLEKLSCSAERVNELIPLVHDERPDVMFNLASPDGVRVAFGFQIPIVLFNDEPRSYATCKLTLPFANRVIVPRCIPVEWYMDHYVIDSKVLVRFNGIDEVAWVQGFRPDRGFLSKLGLEAFNYVICRTEMTTASYLINDMRPHETLLSQILPSLLDNYRDLKFLVLVRNEWQHESLREQFKVEIDDGRVLLFRGLSNLLHYEYHAKLVLSGGGTITRESPLLGTPSIEFFPGMTYPQERFLMENGFPLQHIKDVSEIFNSACQHLDRKVNLALKHRIMQKVANLDNPVNVGYEHLLQVYGLRHPDLK